MIQSNRNCRQNVYKQSSSVKNCGQIEGRKCHISNKKDILQCYGRAQKKRLEV